MADAKRHTNSSDGCTSWPRAGSLSLQVIGARVTQEQLARFLRVGTGIGMETTEDSLPLEEPRTHLPGECCSFDATAKRLNDVEKRYLFLRVNF